MKKIFVTGGHYTPARAVVGELLKKGDYKIFYIGRKFALEGDKAVSLEFQEMKGRADITFLEITTGRLQRKFTKNTIPSLLKIPVGFIQSLSWIMKYRPDIVMSFGGYVSIPVSTTARLFQIPVINHEQIPAFDYPSKYLNKISTKVLVSFPHLVKSREIYTGNPVRPEIFKDNAKLSLPKGKTIYVTGGNQGSHIMNASVLKILPELLKKYNVIWQTGDSKEFQDYSEAVKTISDKLIVKKFINSEEIGSVFKSADLVISRSGANTVTELSALKKPAILIPIPWVHDAEQQKNAEALAKSGAVEIIPQDKLTPDLLLSEVNSYMENITIKKRLAEKSHSLYIPDSANRIVREIVDTLK